jgi:hypothetical protein
MRLSYCKHACSQGTGSIIITMTSMIDVVVQSATTFCACNMKFMHAQSQKILIMHTITHRVVAISITE